MATRTMAGVVALIAVVLLALAATTYVSAGRIVDAELKDNLEQVWQRTNGFLVEGAPGGDNGNPSGPGHPRDTNSTPEATNGSPKDPRGRTHPNPNPLTTS